MARRRRHARTPRTRALGSVGVAVSILLGVALVGGGAVYGAYQYDAATSDRVLPGVTVAGVDVGEMNRADAVAAVRQATRSEVTERITVRAGGRAWHVTPGELGTVARIGPAVEQALAVSEDYSWPVRVFNRLLDREVSASVDVEFAHHRQAVVRFVETVARSVKVDPTDASVEFVDGELVLSKPEEGHRVNERAAVRHLMAAIAGRDEAVRFAMRTLKPDVTVQDLGHTIVVDLSDLKLHLYEGLEEVKTYEVAAGQPAYPTPTGGFEIIDKVEMPSWTNPDPEGWGAGLPEYIPPGPSNPLGTRALYLDAPGIRIHGTSADYSIGTFASHGCVRMHMEDVEELFEIVPVGTPVHIVA
jgi:lipoprotein-anchoring transpeptidase ErfK/SrfK